MRSAIQQLKEVMGVEAPAVFKLLGNSLIELDGKIVELQQAKQDKPDVDNSPVTVNDLSRTVLQSNLHIILSTAGRDYDQIATKLHRFLSGLMSE